MTGSLLWRRQQEGEHLEGDFPGMRQEEDVRVHNSTEILHLAAHLTGINVKAFLLRPTDVNDAEGRVFWMSVEAELGARQTEGPGQP